MARRWTCPQCQGGKLAPERPAKDDVRRYCLPCSERSGKLVKRVCDSLERQRAAKAAATRARAKQQRAAKTRRKSEAVKRSERMRRERLQAAGVEGSLEDLFRAVCRLKCWRGLRLGDLELGWRCGTGSYTSGHAFYRDNRVVVTLAAPAQSRSVAMRWADVMETLIHEVAHHAAFRRHGNTPVGHDFRFKRELIMGVEEWTGRKVETNLDEWCRLVDDACERTLAAVYESAVEGNG